MLPVHLVRQFLKRTLIQKGQRILVLWIKRCHNFVRLHVLAMYLLHLHGPRSLFYRSYYTSLFRCLASLSPSIHSHLQQKSVAFFALLSKTSIGKLFSVCRSLTDSIKAARTVELICRFCVHLQEILHLNPSKILLQGAHATSRSFCIV